MVAFFYIECSELLRGLRSRLTPRQKDFIIAGVLPERGVTVHTGDMGYTFGLCEESEGALAGVQPHGERLKFVARVLDGEKIAAQCREFGISRKTGHKIISRYNDSGLEGLTDRSRRPYRHANQLPFQIEKLIVRTKQDKPNWGAPKIRERLARLYPDVHTPAISTVHAVLDRNAWSSTVGGGATGLKEQHSPILGCPTTCGAPITKASSCLPISAIATR